MTPVVMRHFGFTLSQWMNIGFLEDHVANMDDESTESLFDMRKNEVVEIISNYKL
jgi:hypothetical protein